MAKITPKILRKDLLALSISNTAVARELQISIRDVEAFRKGRDQSISEYKQALLAAYIKRLKNAG